jgi:hypothetical protein
MMRRALIASLLLLRFAKCCDGLEQLFHWEFRLKCGHYNLQTSIVPLIFAGTLQPVTANLDHRAPSAASVRFADSGAAADDIQRLTSATQLCSAPSFHAINAAALTSH